jgi:hypothetical protein
MSSTIRFKELSLRNFMSFGNSECVVSLDNQGTVTITGENTDTGGSNGAGKCVYPKTCINIRVKGDIRQVTMEELYELARQMEANKR